MLSAEQQTLAAFHAGKLYLKLTGHPSNSVQRDALQGFGSMKFHCPCSGSRKFITFLKHLLRTSSWCLTVWHLNWPLSVNENFESPKGVFIGLTYYNDD